MDKFRWIAALTALCLLLAGVPAALAEDEVVSEPVDEIIEAPADDVFSKPGDEIVSSPVDEYVDEAPGDLWTDEIAVDVNAAQNDDEEEAPAIAIDAEHFPDAVFREYIAVNFDADDDGALSADEIEDATAVDVAGLGVQNLEGLALLTQLTYLDVSANALTDLDISANTELDCLFCEQNQLKKLNLKKNKKLENLQCNQNQLTSLDLRNNKSLTSVYCYENPLTSLKVSDLETLETLACADAKLKTLDVTGCDALISVDAINNRLTRLTVAGCAQLSLVYCNCNNLDVLDLSGCKKLIKCAGTQPTEDDGSLSFFHSGSSLFVDPDIRLTADSRTLYERTDIALADCVVEAVEDQVVTGRAIKPAPVVKFGSRTLLKGTDYTVAYRKNKGVGTATIVIKGKGKYTGSVKIAFNIVPKAVALTGLAAGSKRLTVKWKKGEDVTGYEVQYSLKKSFAASTTVTIDKAATVRTTLKNLKARKIYYVRVRAFKTVDGRNYCSEWSNIKYKKTK